MADATKSASGVLQDMLAAQAANIGKEWSIRDYREHEEPAAVDGDRWLDEGKSYVWKVGALVVWDANKCDWLSIFVGMQRSPRSKAEFIGKLDFREGEGDDCARTLGRMLDCLGSIYNCGPLGGRLPRFDYGQYD